MDTYETKIYAAVLIASLIIGVFIAIFLISLIRNQRRVLELHRRNILIEVTTLENERSRIAADLHDELAPMLYLVKYQVSSLDIQDKEDNALQEKSINVLETIGERIRSISRDLLPSALTRKGMIPALEEYISDLNAHSPLKIIFQHHTRTAFSQVTSVNTFRILQEIIQNVLKHAKAKELLIKIDEDKEHLRILCEDNGVGFNYTGQIESGKGLGLSNMVSRIEILNGSIKVNSVPGKGTQYVFKIPIKP